MANELRALLRIRGNIARRASRDGVKRLAEPIFVELLRNGQRRFRSRLATMAVSDQFNNTIASKRLYNSFETNLPSVLRWRQDGVTFSFAFRSSPANSRRSDPAEYIEAIDNAETRRGGPSKQRVRQWLYDRGILAPGQRKVVIGGRTVSDKRLIFLVQRGIWRKTRQRRYRSLKIAEMFEELVDLGNPNSPLRVGLRRRLTGIVASNE